MSVKPDEKLDVCLKFVLRQYNVFVARTGGESESAAAGCFVVGITGCQGCGKTTLASTLASTLSAEPHRIPTLTCSIDQFYLTHDAQLDLARSHPSNYLIQHRGQPSTHDLPLAIDVLTSLRRGSPTSVPSFDKGAFNGEGDRDPYQAWQTVNSVPEERVKILILEGWCVGFVALPASSLTQKWTDAVRGYVHKTHHSRLAGCKLSSLFFINSALRDYNNLTLLMDCLIHLDAQDSEFVYAWRLEQERSLWKTHRAGMTDDQVIDFVNNYYPAYELYTDHLRSDKSSVRYQRLRLVLNVERHLICTLNNDGKSN